MEDKKETEKVDEYGKQASRGEEYFIHSFIQLLTLQTLKSLKSNPLFMGRGLSVWLYFV